MRAPWGWHHSVETCRSVVIYKFIVIVFLLVNLQNSKKCWVHILKEYVLSVLLSCKTLCVCFTHSVFYVCAFHLFHPLLKQLQKFRNSSAFKRKPVLNFTTFLFSTPSARIVSTDTITKTTEYPEVQQCRRILWLHSGHISYSEA